MRSPKSKLQLWNKLFISTVFSRNDKRLSNLQLQVGDEGLDRISYYSIKQEVSDQPPEQVGANTVANAMLSETVALLIDRLSSMTPRQKIG